MSEEGNNRAYMDTLIFIDKFENLRQVQRELGYELIDTKFTNQELVRLLLLLGDLKHIYGKEIYK